MKFVEGGFFPADFDYFRVELWAKFASANEGAPIDYNPGDYVMHMGDLYQCIATAPHTNKVPAHRQARAHADTHAHGRARPAVRWTRPYIRGNRKRLSAPVDPL